MNKNSYLGVRILIYMMISFLTPICTGFAALDTPEKIQAMLWTKWLVMGLSALLASLVALRAFLDQSVTRANEEPEVQK